MRWVGNNWRPVTRRRGRQRPSDAVARGPLRTGGKGGRCCQGGSLRPAACGLDSGLAVAAGHFAGIRMRVRVRTAVTIPVAVLMRRLRRLPARSLEHGCLTRQYEHQWRDNQSERGTAQHSRRRHGSVCVRPHRKPGAATCTYVRRTLRRRSGYGAYSMCRMNSGPDPGVGVGARRGVASRPAAPRPEPAARPSPLSGAPRKTP